MVMAAPDIPGMSFWFAVIGLLVMSMISTHFIEKPLARKLRRRYASGNRQETGAVAAAK
jgi:peptidoglycan/LPS O-acetylase OafA/YrhL